MLDASEYAAQFHILRELPYKLAAGLAFTGATALASVFCALLTGSRGSLVAAVLVMGIATAIFAVTGQVGTHQVELNGLWRWVFAAQLAFLGVGGIWVLALACQQLLRRRDAESLLLFLWVSGTLVFAILVNWSVNGRSLLPLAPAAGLLLGFDSTLTDRRKKYLSAGLALSGVLAGQVVLADQSWASAARDAAQRIHDENPGHPVWFQGHWGFQYYMEMLGAHPVDFSGSRFEPQDLLVVPHNNTNFMRSLLEMQGAAKTVAYDAKQWCTVNDRRAGAGFYSDWYGPLPFFIGKSFPDAYSIFRLRNAFQFTPTGGRAPR